MSAAAVLEISLLALQTVNLARKMIDPSAADPVIRDIFARAASGQLGEQEARDALQAHMREAGAGVMEKWRAGKPEGTA